MRKKLFKSSSRIHILAIVLLCIFLIDVICPATSVVYGATSMTKEEKTRQTSLEKLYGITINMEQGFWGYTYFLDELEQSYNNFPQNLIKEMTDYYKSKGKKVVVKLKYSLDKVGEIGGSFSGEGKTIYINVYPQGVNELPGRQTLAHETGHFLQMYINDKYGAAKLKNAWVKLNDKVAYSGSKWRTEGDKYPEYFPRSYGLANYGDDFSVIVEYLAGAPDKMRNILYSSPNSPIAKKVNLLNSILNKISSGYKKDKTPWGTAIPEKPTDYFKKDYALAAEAGIIPRDSDYEEDGATSLSQSFLGLYTSGIEREKVAELFVNLFAQGSGTDIYYFTKSKGGKTDWYYNQTIDSEPNPDGSLKVGYDTNIPFKDTINDSVLYLYSLKVIELPKDKKFRPNQILKGKELFEMLQAAAAVNGVEIEMNEITTDAVIKSDIVTYEQAISAIYRLFKKMEGSF
jgi:hypothetical protein